MLIMTQQNNSDKGVVGDKPWIMIALGIWWGWWRQAGQIHCEEATGREIACCFLPVLYGYGSSLLRPKIFVFLTWDTPQSKHVAYKHLE
jgi:hypothetical protein